MRAAPWSRKVAAGVMRYSAPMRGVLLIAIFLSLTPAWAQRPEVALCIDAEPLSRAAAEVVAARVQAARVVPRRRCPAFGFRAQVMDAGVAARLVLHTPDGQRLSRSLPWLRSADAALMHTAMADQLGVFAARLAGLITEARLSIAPGPVAVAPGSVSPDSAAPGSPTPSPVAIAPPSRPTPKRTTRRPKRRPVAPRVVPAAQAPSAESAAAESTVAESEAVDSPVDSPVDPPAMRPPPPPEPSVLAPPPPELSVLEPPAVRTPTAPAPSIMPITPPARHWQVAADLGVRVRGAAGLAPDTAVRLGWRNVLAELNWQPASDTEVESRAMRLSGLAMGLGVEWPGWRGDALRVSVPLSVIAERMQVQRLDVPATPHALWKGGVRAGLRLGVKLTDGWFLEGSLDGRVMPLGRVRVADGPELSLNQLGARAGLGLLFLPGVDQVIRNR